MTLEEALAILPEAIEEIDESLDALANAGNIILARDGIGRTRKRLQELADVFRIERTD